MSPVQRSFEERYRCHHCRDSGSFVVFRPESYDAILSGTYERGKHLRTVAVACHNCEMGFRRSDPDSVKEYNVTLARDARKMRPMVRYSEDEKGQSVMLRPRTDFESIPIDEFGMLSIDICSWQEQFLFEHVMKRIQPIGYHSEFEAYA